VGWGNLERREEVLFIDSSTLVMGPGPKLLTRVGSAIYGLGLNFENFP